MEHPLDQTTLSTISLLESRLLRIEHLLYGSSTPSTAHESALRQMADLEKRFSILTSRIRVYGDLLKIYKARPDFFQTPAATEPPSQLPIDAVRAIVLSAAPSFPATVSALTAVQDTPVPDPTESAALVALTERMRGVEATQRAQEAEVVELRARSEATLRSWYEAGLLPTSDATAEVEARVGRVERMVRRKERERELEKEI
ncbi:hypothetical protein LEL_06581 [Akanthomyces lecanii RCEF 1005]|uniref:Nuclear distribution protein n=1 Tax=Akanthomyces lecanii RCEF 1005 TaxID=1081108 RepID=A0A168GTH4_CORDF|nr:hypothetical protein LEL_06581 [Akanthomyces lecanii RCEF 1005]